jgi:DNA repair protein RecO (recombination protein O)
VPPRFINTEGIILRKYDFSETSQVLTVLTRDRGRLQLLAKGLRRIRKKPVVFLDLLDRAELVLIPKPPGSLSTLTEYRVLDDHPGLRDDLLRMAAAFFTAELVTLASQEHQPLEPLYDLHVAALESLATAPRSALPSLLLAFEIRFLRRIGFGLELDGCVVCGRSRSGLRTTFFSPLRGGLLCPDCRSSDPSAVETASGVFPILRSLGGGSWDSATRTRIPWRIYREARRLLQRDYLLLFERTLRSTRWLERAAAGSAAAPP